MGNLLGNLTNTQVSDPSTGQTQYYGNKDQASLAAGNAALNNPKQMMTFDPSKLNSDVPVDQAFGTKNISPGVQSSKPSFVQAAQQNLSRPGGALTDPSLTKGGKLLQILGSAVQGGVAGYAAGQHGNPREGYGGAAAGFQAGQQLPFIQAQQRREQAMGNMQLQQAQMQNQYFPQILAQGMMKTRSEIAKNEGEGAKAQASADSQPIENALHQAQMEAAMYKDDPNLGLIDLRTKQPVAGTGVAFAPLTPEEAQILGKQPGENVPLKIKNIANEIVQRGLGTVPGEKDTYIVNKGTGKTSPLGIGSPRAMFAPENRIIPAAADPSNPGNLTYMKAGDALKTGAMAPGSAPVQAAKTTLKSATTGQIGNESNAFQTAMAHAELLKQAAQEMQNPNSRTLAGIRNRLNTEFGDSDLTNFNAIAGAYSREVTKMLSAGHMTDAEIGAAGATLPSNANLPTLLKVIDSYKNLAASKMKLRQDQTNRGLQGKPNFPEAPQAGATATGPNGHKLVLQNGAWVDSTTGKALQ